MLIKSLSLKEFKCFEQVDIDFGKITLLTGANSSGKSSLIYALLGIMQSKYFPQYFALNGELVNMGGFEDVLRKKAEEKELEVSIAYEQKNEGENKILTKWIEDPDSQQPQLLYLNDSYGTVRKNKEGLTLINYFFFIHTQMANYYFKKTNELFKNSPKLKFIFAEKEKKANELFKNSPNLKFTLAEKDDDEVSVDMNGISSFSVDEFIEKSKNFLSIPEIDFLENYNFNYIGSFRLPPERTYYRKPNANQVGVNGEGYIDQIIKWKESDIKIFQKLENVVSEMGLFKSISSNMMKGGRFELNVKVNENSTLASLTDVGFGISQFLPIIVADLQLSDESCLAVSQPEIHLHPKIQATLGDYFAKQVKETEKQYIVETHSEYLINRLRLLIVKGELQPEDVKLYYMENDGDKTTTYPIELTTDGQIKNAPQGFFDTYEMDVMDIALFASAQ